MFAVYLRFQGALMSIAQNTNIYGIKFCWLWFQNVFKILSNANYTKQNFCYVLREFLIKVEAELQIDNAAEFLKMIEALKTNILPRLEGMDQSKNALEAYLSNFVRRNQFF